MIIGLWLVHKFLFYLNLYISRRIAISPFSFEKNIGLFFECCYIIGNVRTVLTEKIYCKNMQK